MTNHKNDKADSALCDFSPFGIVSDKNHSIVYRWDWVDCEECLKHKPGITNLVDMVKEFLSERSASTGNGWAEVKENDVTAVLDILDLMFELKYERDCDGDLPIEACVVDRTKFHGLRYCAVPYETDKTDLINKSSRIRAMATNHAISNSEVDIYTKLELHDIEKEISDAKD